MHGFRTRVSELRNTYNIALEAVKRNGIKANGNAYYYFEHFLKEESVNDATVLLERLSKNEKSINKTKIGATSSGEIAKAFGSSSHKPAIGSRVEAI